MISTKFDSLLPLFQEFKLCSPLQALLNSQEFLTVLSLLLALIFQAILADKAVSVSALVVLLASAQTFAMTTMNAPTINAFQAKEETDAHSLPSLALMETFAPLILAFPLFQEDAFSPTSPAMTTILAQTTTVSDLLVARASKEFATTTMSVLQIPAIQTIPTDASSPLFPPANATCADLWFALQFHAALLDVKMELAMPPQFLAMIEMPAQQTLAIQ